MQVRKRLLDADGIVILCSFGQLSGNMLLIGLMGSSSMEGNAGLLIAALGKAL